MGDIDASGSRPKARGWYVAVGVILTAAGTFFVGASSFGQLVLDALRDGTSPTSSPSASQAASGLKLVPLVTKKVPRCSAYAGVGHLPAGHQLLIFERAVGAQGEDIGERWGYFGRAITNADGWHTPNMDHGADHVEVTAVLVSQALDDFFSSLKLVDDNGTAFEGGWQVSNLPPGEKVASLLPDPDLSTAHCSS